MAPPAVALSTITWRGIIMHRECGFRPHKDQESRHICPEWTFTTKDVLMILGLALGLSGLMGFGAILLVESIGTLLH
jgi:hypothetical protein